MRKSLRIERRMEFAFEGLLRHDDIIRWKLAEKALNKPFYGMIDPAEQREKIVKPGLWFFPEVVPIDKMVFQISHPCLIMDIVKYWL